MLALARAMVDRPPPAASSTSPTLGLAPAVVRESVRSPRGDGAGRHGYRHRRNNAAALALWPLPRAGVILKAGQVCTARHVGPNCWPIRSWRR
jgi:hypothetical protein